MCCCLTCFLDGEDIQHLCVSQVGVSSKQDGDIIRRTCHLPHHQCQLSHPLCCVGLTALKVWRHQIKRLASEQHLSLRSVKVKPGFSDSTFTGVTLITEHQPEPWAGSSSSDWVESRISCCPAGWPVTSSASSRHSNPLYQLMVRREQRGGSNCTQS